MEYNRLMTTFGLSVAASAIVSLLSGFVGHLVGLIFVKESIVVFAVMDKGHFRLVRKKVLLQLVLTIPGHS